MRARMALYYSKIDYEHREILLRNRPEKLYQLSQKGVLPERILIGSGSRPTCILIIHISDA